MATTVEHLAAARGRHVDEVIEAARQAGLTVWTGATPLDDSEVARIDAALARIPPRGGLQAWPVPPGAQPGPLPPPSGPQIWPGPPQGFAPPPPPPPPAPAPSMSAGKIVAIVLVAVVVSIAGLVGVIALLGTDNDSAAQFESVGDSIDLGDSDLDDAPQRTTVPPLPGVSDLTVGECFNDLSTPTEDPTAIVMADYEEVGCAQAHDAEVYLVAVHPDPPGTPFPGDDAVVGFAEERCLEAFQPFVGESYEFSSLDFLYLFPTEVGWQRLDDRLVVCAVVTLDGSTLTGSMEGSGA